MMYVLNKCSCIVQCVKNGYKTEIKEVFLPKLHNTRGQKCVRKCTSLILLLTWKNVECNFLLIYILQFHNILIW